MGNHKFTVNTPEQVDRIENKLLEEFSCSEKEFPDGQGFSFKIEVHGNGSSVTAVGYESGTCMLQASDENEFKEKVAATVRSLEFISEDNGPNITKKESQIGKKIFLGFDESGKGEMIGSLFLGCAIVENDAIEEWNNRLEDQKVKSMDKKDLDYWIKEINKDSRIKTETIRITALDIVHSGYGMNQLMDNGYREILQNNRNRMADSCVIVDNYEIGDALQQEFKYWRDQGAEVKIETKADENYVSAKIASIVSRRERKEEVESIIEDNKLISENEVLELRDGPSPPENDEWLKEFRSRYPRRRFPHFVRTNWGNVEEIEDQHPRQNPKTYITCSSCDKDSKLIYAVKSGKITLKCAHCGGSLESEVLSDVDVVIPDTSSLVRRTFSIDLKSEEYFRNSIVLLPEKIQQEIDDLGDNMRKGANNELEDLTKLSEGSKINLTKSNTAFRGKPFLTDSQRDEKIVKEAVKEDNAILVTADDTMASSATGNLRVHLVGKDKWERDKYDLLLD